MRIRRHDCIATCIKKSLDAKGYITAVEPCLQLNDGLRKPDLVSKLGRKAVIIDAQIVSDSCRLDEAHAQKRSKYSSEEIVNKIKEMYDVDDVAVATVTLNWRGIWSGESARQLINLNLIQNRDLAVFSIKVAVGSVACFNTFTQYSNFRRGIG